MSVHKQATVVVMPGVSTALVSADQFTSGQFNHVQLGSGAQYGQTPC